MLAELLKVSRESLQKVDDELITKAFAFMLEAHRHDLRSSGEPYYTHPYEVALIVAREFPLDDTTIVSSLLHDVIEDTEFSLEVLAAEFSK